MICVTYDPGDLLVNVQDEDIWLVLSEKYALCLYATCPDFSLVICNSIFYGSGWRTCTHAYLPTFTESE